MRSSQRMHNDVHQDAVKQHQQIKLDKMNLAVTLRGNKLALLSSFRQRSKRENVKDPVREFYFKTK